MPPESTQGPHAAPLAAEPGHRSRTETAPRPPTGGPGRSATPQGRSAADRIARQLLLVERADPKAIFNLKGSLLISAVRCTLTYALIPLLAPMISWAGIVAAPVALVLSVLAVGMAVNSLRRVWLADYRYRWPYTGFILVVLVLLAIVIVWDIRAVLG